MRYLLLFSLALWIANTAAAADYISYHKAVNKAEEYIFIHNQPDSGLAVYTQLFKDFDFVYAGDCMIALQIALLNGNEKAFVRFTEKAFRNGMMLRHFKRIYSIRKSPFYLKDTTRFERLYRECRPHYLKRIDTAVLRQMMQLFVDDQLVKNGPKNRTETERQYNERYTPLIALSFRQLNTIIMQKGFPLDQLIGIGQRDIMKELKIDAPDINEYYWRNKNRNEYAIREDQFIIDEYLMYSSFLFPLLIHYRPAFTSYSDSFYQAQIAAGHIHPKDIGFLNDNYYGYNHGGNPVLQVHTGFSAVGVRPGNRMQPNSLFVPDSIINRYRAKWFIAPIEQDRKKWQFMTEHKLDFGWGYAGMRS